MREKTTKNRSLFLIFHGRFPSEKAAALFAAKSCEAFSGEGIETTLIVPRRLGRSKSDPFAYYKVKDNFRIVYLPTIDLYSLRFLHVFAFWISFIVFSVATLFYLLFNSRHNDIIYSNESLPLLLASYVRKNTLYEVHDFPEHKLWLYTLLLKKVKWVLATNKWKKEKLEKAFSVPSQKVFYEPNAVDVEEFDVPLTQEEARTQLGLPQGDTMAMYTGHLYSWKGVDTLAEAAKEIPSVQVYFVGGTDFDVNRFQQKYGDIPNIKIIGHRPHAEIPVWQKAADILVLPNTAKEDISKYYTSPMKLFEYMASGRPIVASNIPSITELLDKENALLVLPDDVQNLVAGINTLMLSPQKGVLADRALLDVKEHTWSKRAQRIIKKL